MEAGSHHCLDTIASRIRAPAGRMMYVVVIVVLREVISVIILYIWVDSVVFPAADAVIGR
jgi:hypothetical protein